MAPEEIFSQLGRTHFASNLFHFYLCESNLNSDPKHCI